MHEGTERERFFYNLLILVLMAKDTQVCGNCVEMNKMRKLILTRTFGFTEQSLEGDKK